MTLEFNPRVQARHNLFLADQFRLEQFAYRAVNELNHAPHNIFIVCIDVDDTAWTELVDVLMPGYDWQSIRDQGQKPVARGIVQAEGMIDYIRETVPDIQKAVNAINIDGTVTSIVMTAGGASVYSLVPKQQQVLE